MCPSTITQQLLTFAPSILMAVLTLAYVVLTWMILNEYKRMLVSQDRPFLQSQPRHSETGAYVTMRNIGKGPALAAECAVTLIAPDSELPSVTNSLFGLSFAVLEQKEVAHEALVKLAEDIRYREIRITMACRDIYDNDHGPFTTTFIWERYTKEFRIVNESIDDD